MPRYKQEDPKPVAAFEGTRYATHAELLAMFKKAPANTRLYLAVRNPRPVVVDSVATDDEIYMGLSGCVELSRPEAARFVRGLGERCDGVIPYRIDARQQSSVPGLNLWFGA